MKYSNNQIRKLADIKTTLIKEFNKLKFELQCITELKEIKQKPTESVWEFDYRFEVLLDQVSFDIAPQQHQEWFIVVLLLHIKFPLKQQNIGTQVEALEIVMKLEASLIGDTNASM